MVPDPSMIALIQDPLAQNIVGGFVGGFIEPLVSHGISWVSERYRGHPKEAKKSAHRNAVNFYGQVNICLGELQQIEGEGFEEKKEQALADPDYTSLIQEAVLGAARTNSEQKHRLLARLVTDRLIAEPDSLGNLAAHMACKAIPQLSNTHLKLLGVLYIIRQCPIPLYMKDLPDDERIDIGEKWFLSEISRFYPIGDINELDLAHLTAVSCITYVPQLFHSGVGGSFEPGCWNLPRVVRDKLCAHEEPKIDHDQIGKYLLNVWDNSSIRKSSLTPAGSLIGMLARDAVSQENRCI